jgi:hypothetical protein
MIEISRLNVPFTEIDLSFIRKKFLIIARPIFYALIKQKYKIKNLYIKKFIKKIESNVVSFLKVHCWCIIYWVCFNVHVARGWFFSLDDAYVAQIDFYWRLVSVLGF